MGKDIVFLGIERLDSVSDLNKIIEFAAIRVRNGQIHETCHYLLQPEQGLNIKSQIDIRIDELDNELTRSDDRQEIINFLGDAVLVGYEVSSYLSTLQSRLGVQFQQPLWDLFDLAMVFFPTMHHYQLLFLAEKLSLPLRDEAIYLSEKKAWLTWKLFEACWKKGLEFDLSFYSHAVGFVENWNCKDFIEELQKEIIRSFPDRPIRTDLVLTPICEEGLFTEKTSVRIPDSIDWVVDNFSPGGNLELYLPGYESRPGQVKMARLIAKGLSASQHVVVEAGTGTGKSFAYLIPSLWSAKKSGRKVVVATHTIPLQEQLQKKDVPILKTVLSFPFRVSVLKGRNNYCCLKKWQTCLANREIFGTQQKLAALSILVWLRETITGDIQELSKIPGLMELWTNISADTETCIPARCSKAGVCFLLRARKKAEESDVLIVNHSLLFADLKTDYNVLPEYHQLVIDEAHQIYQTALQHLGSELSVENVTRIIDNIYRSTGLNFYGTVKQRQESLARIVPSVSWEIFYKRLEGIPELCGSVLDQVKELFEYLSQILGKERTFRFVAQHTVRPWWQGLNIQIENLVGRIKGLLSVLESLTSILNGEDADEIEELKYTLASHQRDLQSFVDTLILATNVNNPKQVTWLEYSSRLYLKTSPIEVSEILREKIFSRLDSVILTSATLSISNSFEHFLQDVGLPKSTITEQVDSPFDYERQMQFIVVKKGINLYNSDGEKAIELARFITEVAERMNGRTLVLFTAHSMLRQTYDYLNPLLTKTGIQLLAQGIQGERGTLLEAFKRNPKSVLLGANSFWEGIDIPGDTLSCVILVKLPFWPPSLPLIEARSEYLKSLGRDPFHELLLPEAVIRFKQGFGRLIRSKGDRGVVILLDDRVIEKYYGRYFLSSLPINTHIRGENAVVFQKLEEYSSDLGEELL